MIENSSFARNLDRQTEKQNQQPEGVAGRKLKVLLVQRSPGLRLLRLAKALAVRGHGLGLACENASVADSYPGVDLARLFEDTIGLEDPRRFWDLAAAYDVLHCLDDTGQLTVMALGAARPVVHDTGMFASLGRGGSMMEALANRAAHGRVYNTPLLMRAARDLHGVNGPSMVLPNLASRQGTDKKRQKISEADGKTHIACLLCEQAPGPVALGLIKALAAGGVHLHLLHMRRKSGINSALLADRNIHVQGPVAPDSLTGLLSCFDAGLVLRDFDQDDKALWDANLGAELFEYAAAGLPVLAPALAAYEDLLGRYALGHIYNNESELIELTGRLANREAPFDSVSLPCMEDEIGRLEQLYMNLLNAHRRREPGTVLHLSRQAAQPRDAVIHESADLLDLVSGMAEAADKGL